jgi:hypothetical protein
MPGAVIVAKGIGTFLISVGIAITNRIGPFNCSRKEEKMQNCSKIVAKKLHY